jgi:hypothetical protein
VVRSYALGQVLWGLNLSSLPGLKAVDGIAIQNLFPPSLFSKTRRLVSLFLRNGLTRSTRTFSGVAVGAQGIRGAGPGSVCPNEAGGCLI